MNTYELNEMTKKVTTEAMIPLVKAWKRFILEKAERGDIFVPLESPPPPRRPPAPPAIISASEGGDV